MHRDGIRVQVVEGGCRIADVAVADVPAFGVKNDGNLGCSLIDVLNRCAERLPPLVAVSFVEGGIGLVGTHEVFRRIDNDAIKCEHRIADASASLAGGLGNLFKIAIEPHTEKFALLPLGFQELPKIPLSHWRILYPAVNVG